MTGRDARRIDVSRLPADVVALIDALEPGEDLVITRNGEAVATISSTLGAPGSRGSAGPAAEGEVMVVATAMRLSESARASLSAELGTDYIVIDMHAAPPTADVLLVPPVSPQLIGNLRRSFPRARVVVAEIEDAELGVSYEGPVRRMLNAGATTYLPSTTIPRLAHQLDRTITEERQLTGGTRPRREIDAPPGPPPSPA
ncbi:MULTISPECIES: hypothetical protein [Amycolatopsis]|uniref:Antitoxin n=1 Tax=Amycolatopsis thermalba TaxID=944492 RepID=A0ABY4NU65_9PSEU|nr:MULTISPECIES: hypothetical protein [Amycolatopsis]OXM73035.1 hypothetical protein CF166_12325 [Amycolatopsis sp. KNN50.9b]UQS23576.1 hypothetical protein L1857_12455 [Amycolatopsis thermalba]